MQVKNKAAVYVYRDALCMEFGLPRMARYFKTLAEANSFAAGFEFAQVATWGEDETEIPRASEEPDAS